MCVWGGGGGGGGGGVRMWLYIQRYFLTFLSNYTLLYLFRLYNKESLLLALLDKPSLPEVAQHIRTLRDVVELNLTPNPAYKPVSRAMAEGTQCTEFVCPISGLEMSGRHK